MKKCLFALLSAVLPLAFWACDVGSTDSVSGAVSDSSGTVYDFSGTYYPVDDAETLVNPVSMQSGQALTWLRLIQYGSRLEGFDNAKKTWSGKISSVSTAGNAAFTLSGSTTSGHSVEIVGTLRYADGSSTLDGSWIEDVGNAASIFAKAAVSPPVTNSPSATNTPTSTLTVSPTSKTVAFGSNATFQASGGTSPYSWSLSSSAYGTLSTTSGAATTFTATSVSSSASRSVTLTVTDAKSASATASITIANSSTNTPAATLTVSPSSRTVSAGTSVSFTASGGTSPYSWSLSSSDYGTLSAASGSSIVFRASTNAVSGNPTVTLTVSDSASATAHATIIRSN